MSVAKIHSHEELLNMVENFFKGFSNTEKSLESKYLYNKLKLLTEFHDLVFETRNEDVFCFKNNIKIKFVHSKNYNKEDIIRELKGNSDCVIMVFILDPNLEHYIKTIYNSKWKGA